jgi:hypothetical protein
MLCRTLRRLSVGRWCLAGLLCLALFGSAVPTTPVSPEDGETVAISLSAPQFPLAALELTSAVRLEKQAQSVRQSLPRPARNGHLLSGVRAHALLCRPKIITTALLRPRRFLPPRRIGLRASSDSNDPVLASSFPS